MRKQILVIAASSMMALGSWAQNSAKVALTVGNEQITLSEFESVFKKNNNGKKIDKQAIDEYVDLYVKFRMKVKEAREMKLDTARSFKAELNSYVKQLAQPYLKDKSYEDQLINITYERLKKDVKISHIMVTVNGCDSATALAKIEKIRKEILVSKNFEAAARKYSDDTLSGKNGGELGYFTAMTFAYPFETAMYDTKVGEISNIVRSSRGFHILKVHDVRPSRGRVKVAHIFIQAPKDQTKRDAARTKIDEVYQKLKNGENFGDLARTYSEDAKSAQKGGEIPPFGISEYAPVFEDAAFSLTTPGSYTAPFESELGFHILQLVERQTLPDFETIKPEITKAFSKGNRADMLKDRMIQKIKQTYPFKTNAAFWTAVKKQADANNGELTLAYLKTIPEQELFTIGTEKVSTQPFINLFLARPENDKINYCTFLNVAYKGFEASKLMEYKEKNLSAEYSEFAALTNEYRDGILLFNLMDQKVWSKSVKDTAGLQAFYEKNKMNYMWGERAQTYIIDCKDVNVEKAARKLAPSLVEGKITKEQFLAKLNKKASDNVIIIDGLYSKGENELVNAMNWAPGVGETSTKNEKIRFAVIQKIVAPQPKLLKEAKGVIISDYQNYLEQTWIEALKSKYPVVINKDVLYSIIP